ncbi:hypothetical protein SLS56_001008 [Neofusicoccum ribis]|uniref:NACHT domain-containing protein n=1 Tax=Neofusicoccum ribis TaxID=45134 RepID=A0ABR3TBZ0_9PEZI
MVLEVFAALGLAGNIVQFVDFSCKLVSESRSIHESAKDVSEKFLELDVVSHELISLADKVDSASSTGRLSPGLEIITQKCRELAKYLSDDLEKLRPKKSKTPWRSFVQAMKEAGKSERLKDLAERICVLQGLLNSHLLQLMSLEMRRQFSDLSAENVRLNMKQSEDIERLSESVNKALQDLQKKSTLQHATLMDHLGRIQRLEPVEDADLIKPSETMTTLSLRLQILSNAGSTISSEQCLLKSLYFRSLSDRQENVAVAHESTLKWLLSDRPPKSYSGRHPRLAEWLREGNGIYWVQGKPGYICGHTVTNSLLEQWSHPKRLITADFFFWTSGTNMERSQKGLLQGLLYEVLRQCPELIPKIYPDLNAVHYHSQEVPWSFSELKSVIVKLKEQSAVSARFCFFIDGLDEYDGDSREGTHDDLVQTIKGLTESQHIKICLSSRPWNVFRDSFDHCRSLALEDLSHDDIDAYVRNTLAEDHRFVRLRKNSPIYGKLVDEIIEKAQGVFLWVYLVVRSLKQGLVNADTIDVLRQRVQCLPSDLKTFFRQILDSIDEVYKPQTAKTLKIMLNTDEPLPLMAVALLDEDDCFGLTTDVDNGNSLDKAKTVTILGELRRRLDGRCKGLVEVTKAKSSHRQLVRPSARKLFFTTSIDFLHRTVRDFLLSKDTEYLFDSLEPGFDIDLTMAKVNLQLIKVAPIGKELSADAFKRFARHIKNLEKKTQKLLQWICSLTQSNITQHLESRTKQPF